MAEMLIVSTHGIFSDLFLDQRYYLQSTMMLATDIVLFTYTGVMLTNILTIYTRCLNISILIFNSDIQYMKIFETRTVS